MLSAAVRSTDRRSNEQSSRRLVGTGALVNVLICDDEPDMQLLLQMTVRALGHEARAVGSADEAQALIEEQRPDVLLLDVSMPGTDGPTLVRRLRDTDLLEPPRTMLVSAITAQELEELARELGVRYLPKPCTYSDIAQAMDELAA